MKLLFIHFLQALPDVQNYEDIGLKSFLIFVILCLGFAVKFLYTSKEKASNEHKEDLKYFDSEKAKTVNELTQTINKIAISIEQNKNDNHEINQMLNKVVMLIEQIKNDINNGK